MSRWPPLRLVGLTHRNATLGLRERFSLSRAETVALLEERCGDGSSAVVLSTCNRFEIYWWGDAPWEAWLLHSAAAKSVSLPPEALIRRDGLAAARHLFAVAAGLESQIVGETEVLGQVRRAWELARETECSSRELDLVFAAALAAGRRVRRRSFAGRHPASVGSAAVEIAKTDRGGTLVGARVVVLGAGQAAQAVIAALLKHDGITFRVLSRHPERATRLAPDGSIEVAPWSALTESLGQADLVFAATSAARAIVSREQLAAALIRPRQLTVLDLGVPRNVDPESRNLAGLALLDLDDLRARGCPIGASGSSALREAEDMLLDETERLSGRLRALAAGARLARLHRAGEAIAREEADRALEELGRLGDTERDVVRRMAQRLARRILYPASQMLKDREPSAPEEEPLGETTA